MNNRKVKNKTAGMVSNLRNFVVRNWPIIIFCLVHAVILLCMFQSGFFYEKLYMIRANFITEYDYSSRIIQGCNPYIFIHSGYEDTSLILRHCLPYRDFNFEYPPLSVIFITLPRLLASYFNLYVLVYAVELLLFDFVGIFILTSFSKQLGHNPWKTLAIYTIVLLAVGPLVVTRFDFIPAILTLISIFFFIKKRSKTAWAFLAAATLTKIYPLVIAPIFLLIQLSRSEKKNLLEGLLAFIITSAVITVPFVILSPSGFWESFSYHTQRPLQIESTYASVLELLSAFKIFDLNIALGYGSVNVIGTVPDILAKISFGITILGLLAVYWSANRGLKHSHINQQNWAVQSDETAFIVKYSLMAILVFIVSCKVFSPQYIIWLLPLIPLITHKSKYLIWLLFIAVGIMTFFIFPQYYDSLRNGSMLIISLLVIRNVTVFGILLLVIRSSYLGAKFTERLQDTATR